MLDESRRLSKLPVFEAFPCVESESFEAAGETSPCSIHEPMIGAGRRRETAHLLQRLISCDGRRCHSARGFADAIIRRKSGRGHAARGMAVLWAGRFGRSRSGHDAIAP